jgi:hypothetical protein
MTRTDIDDAQDKALDDALARSLGPDADDTADLSRAVLSRIAAGTTSAPHPLAKVLAAPLPATGALCGALLLAGAAGYALLPVVAGDELALFVLFGQGI